MSLSFVKVGDLLHFHPFAPAVVLPKTVPVGKAPKGSAEPPAPRRRDDLAFLGLSIEGGPVDPRAELGRCALLPEDGAGTARDDERWDNPWLEMP